MKENAFIEVLKDIVFSNCWTMSVNNVENCPKMINLGGNTHLADKESEGHLEWPVQVDQWPRGAECFCSTAGSLEGWLVSGNRWKAPVAPHVAAYSFLPTAGRNRKEQKGENLRAEIDILGGEAKKGPSSSKAARRVHSQFPTDRQMSMYFLGSRTSASVVVTWESKHLNPKHPSLHPPFLQARLLSSSKHCNYSLKKLEAFI